MLFKGIVKWKAPPAGLTNTSSSSNQFSQEVSHPGTDQLQWASGLGLQSDMAVFSQKQQFTVKKILNDGFVLL